MAENGKKARRRRRSTWSAPVLARIDELLLSDPDVSAAGLYATLMYEAMQGLVEFEPTGVPSSRTLQNMLKDRRPQRANDRWTLEGVSEEEAALVFPVLQHVVQRTEGKVTHLTGAEAAQIRKIRRLEPEPYPKGMSLWDVYVLAQEYVLMAQKGESPMGADAYLAFRPWKGMKEAFMYEEAVRDGRIAPRYLGTRFRTTQQEDDGVDE